MNKNTKKLIDSTILGALYMMSKNNLEGASYKEFIPGLTEAARELVKKGHARKFYAEQNQVIPLLSTAVYY